jgi:hypothetical protein
MLLLLLLLQDGWTSKETEHYVVRGESGAKIVEEYAVAMELLFREYAKAFKFDGKLEKKAEVHIYRNRDSYVRGGGSGSSVAYYDPEKKKLVAYENRELLQFLAHEATHQFFDLAFPTFFSNEDVPFWFSEGIAECFCNCEIRGKTLYINVLNNCENAWRNVEAVQESLRDGTFVGLKEMLAMDARTFRQRADILYPVSWSFCHFLWNAPGQSEGKGRYREVILRLVEAFKAGKKRDEAYKEAFVLHKKPLNLDALDAEWRAYVKTLKARRPAQAKD